jgi:formylglycine-generating enzyme required for sulfatase activity/serine/threonine protein kinase
VSSDDPELRRLRDAHGQHGSTGPFVSSLDGLSMLESGKGVNAPRPIDALPPGLANHPDYEVLRELGQGGMGTVYLALNKLMGRHEVLKVVSRHMLNRSGAPDRFLVEIRNAARLHHTNIVTAFSAMRIGESMVFAMEYVDGLDLSRLVKARGPLPVSNACNYVHQAALGLQHANELGMTHRDIKPSNLMLAKLGDRAIIKVLDFGLAKVRSEGAVDGSLTHEGQLLGTPDYVAPEQIRDARRADIRADIYSLGCTLYYLLTGGAPFQADNLYEILQAHHSMDALPLNLARPEVPIELAALVARMMAKEPHRRFQTPKDVAKALLPFFDKRTSGTAGTPPEMSQPGGSDHDPASTRVPSVVTQPTTEMAPSSAARPRLPTWATPDLERALESLTEPKETKPVERPALRSAGSARLTRWIWPSLAAGLLLGFIVIGTMIVKVDPTNGVISLEDVPKDSLTSEPVLSTASGTTTTDRDRTNGSVLISNATTTPTGSPTKSLFNRTDLGGWEFDKSDARMWLVDHGTLMALNPDGRGMGARGRGRLLTTQSFQDFIFRFEYQASSDFDFAAVWWALPGEIPATFRPAISALGLNTNRGGGRLSSRGKRSELKEGAGWNVVEVEARDRLIRVSVNGKETVRRVLAEKPAKPIALLATKPAGPFPRAGVDRRTGRVGFEVDIGGPGRFRNIEIEELPSSPDVKSSSQKPAIDVVEDLVEQDDGVEPTDIPKPLPTAPAESPNSIDNTIGMTLKLIPAGEFTMGSPDSDKQGAFAEWPPHKVRISSFYLGVTEVTQAQFLAVMGRNPSYFSPTGGGKTKIAGRPTGQYPVENVSWWDAVRFCDALSKKDGRNPFYTKGSPNNVRTNKSPGYRLPTEAEWEYACRAGTETRYSFGDRPTRLREHGWFESNAAGTTHTVGKLLRNNFGLYDMHGNVSEWCSDWFDTSYYRHSPAQDPFGPSAGERRVIRSGAWHLNVRDLRSAARFHDAPSGQHNFRGFRVARGKLGL